MTDLPKGWVRAPLHEMARVQLGRQRSPKNHQGMHMRPYVRAANVTWKGLDLSDVKEMNFDPKEAPRFELHPGDLLLAEASGSASEVGKPVLWKGELPGACFQNTLLRVQTDGPLPEYLLYYFKFLASTGAFAKGSRGVGIHHLGKLAMEQFKVPVPPLAEQRRIVDAIEEHLSRIDAAGDALRHARQSTDVLRNLILERSIAPLQPIRRLADVATTQSGGTPSRSNDAYFGGDIPWIKSGELGDGKVSTTAESITPLALKESSAKLVKRGTLLIAMYGATIGKLGVVDLDSAATNQAVCAITPHEPASTEYLWQVLLWKRPDLIAQGKGGAQPNISQGLIRDLLIPYPPIADQERAVAQVKATNSVADIVNKSVDQALSRISYMRQALLAQAFLGNLVPQDPDDDPASVSPERIQAEREASATSMPRRKKVTA